MLFLHEDMPLNHAGFLILWIQIPESENDHKTLLGELNWIFTAITDTIACNVLPHGSVFRR
jgi:hypothetical protein